jgi:hypothetical protein
MRLKQRRPAIAEFNVAAAIGRLAAPNCDCRSGSTTWTATTNAVKDKWIGFAGGLRE